MQQLSRIRSLILMSRSSFQHAPRFSSSSSTPPSSSSLSLSAHIELYRIVLGRETPTTLFMKPSPEQLLIQKILRDNNKVLTLALDQRRQFRRANIKNRLKGKEVEKGIRGKIKPEKQRDREERMSLFLSLLRQHRLLLRKSTVLAVAEYFAEANCYASFMASYGLINEPSELLGTQSIQFKHHMNMIYIYIYS